ncbi:helix-hairpin-helix domain-containing protein [Thalassotalea psychrophila]|uniref:Helix-hairpin-helix domain-containing protein n=1 Tax=Thalassotalea psychrophila TaxID=3065647 RepID=A0ABY9TPZ5_9GAMM|nr:helix-hairpin-helix domain-containing protein [Colwelliaceae bacterium SQ149]
MKKLTTSLLAAALILTPALNTAYANDEPVVTEQRVSTTINVNTASAEQLSELKGIGLKKAQSIIDYRKMHGPFANIADLMNVKGIGVKFIEKNSKYLAI